MSGMQSNKLTFTYIEEAIKKHNDMEQVLLKISDILAI
jgi:6-phosphofructokinase 1